MPDDPPPIALPAAPDDGAAATTGSREDTVSFQLRRAQDASFRAFAGRIDGHGLQPGRFAILQAIAERPGLSQSDLSAVLNRDKTTLTPILQDMQRRALIVRDADPADRRYRRLRLSDAGRQMLATLQEHAQRHDALLDALLGDDDKRALIALLSRITKALSGSTDAC